jgi:hypothetical protein
MRDFKVHPSLIGSFVKAEFTIKETGLSLTMQIEIDGYASSTELSIIGGQMSKVFAEELARKLATAYLESLKRCKDGN